MHPLHILTNACLQALSNKICKMHLFACYFRAVIHPPTSFVFDRDGAGLGILPVVFDGLVLDNGDAASGVYDRAFASHNDRVGS